MTTPSTTVSTQDVASLAEKLDAFLGGLTPAEQTLLGVLLGRPLALPEVQGHAGTLISPPVLQVLSQRFPSATAPVSYLGVLDSYRPH